ncbi:hypothetical protein D3C84_1064140 [compost metagenome]
MFNRLIVVAGNTYNFGTVRSDSVFSLDAHISMQNDYAFAANVLGRGSETFPVVTVSRAYDSERGQIALIFATEQELWVKIAIWESSENQAYQSYRSTQSFEAAEFGAHRLIFDFNR